MRKSGFTLIELMIVVAILGILASLAVVKYASLMRKANEGVVQGDLGSLRSAISIYYSDTTGEVPADLSGLTVNGKYLTALPRLRIPDYHPASAAVALGAADDSGGWVFDNAPSSSRYGSVWVNCTHTDTKGSVWSSY